MFLSFLCHYTFKNMHISQICSTVMLVEKENQIYRIMLEKVIRAHAFSFGKSLDLEDVKKEIDV